MSDLVTPRDRGPAGAASRSGERPAAEPSSAGPAWPALAAAGVAAVASALAISELIAGLLPGAPSLILSVGGLIIDLQPPGAKDVVVELFGENDKLALEVLIVLVAIAIGAGLGIVARRRFWLASLAFGTAGLVALLAASGDPQISPFLAIVSAVVAAGTGIATLSWLLDRVGRTPTGHPSVEAGSMPNWSRRALLIRSGAVAAGSLVVGVAGRRLLEAQRIVPVDAGDLPKPTETASLPAGAELAVAGITPIVMPNDLFYRIDTALIVPRIDVTTWTLRIHGLVERETELTWAELTALPTIEQYVTIACVSNEVGGRLVGNAKWTGVRLRDVLDIAGVQLGASQLVGRSVDGFTAGMPTAWVMDPSRDPMIAIAMNDEPLPLLHGYPARLIVPGLYGYVSATKWLSELQLTTLEDFNGYWVPLGWAKEAPILTQTRIDVPRFGSLLPPGPTAVAGVAWAPDRGISAVEISVDGGAWQRAVLSTPISDATWVQWVVTWDAPVGDHTIEARATDGHGVVQTADRSRPAPDGARGHHSINVAVRS